jgi:hypothetical protein
VPALHVRQYARHSDALNHANETWLRMTDRGDYMQDAQ